MSSAPSGVTATETTETEPPPNTGTVDTGTTADTGSFENRFPNAAEAALLEHVPADTGIQATCARETELVPPGAIASLVCTAPGGTTLLYYQFDGLDSMNDWYDKVVADAGALRDSGDCVEDEFAESTWPYRESVGGRLLCAPSRSGDYRYMFWTSQAFNIGSVAAVTGNTPDVQRSLYDLWLSTLGPI